MGGLQDKRAVALELLVPKMVSATLLTPFELFRGVTSSVLQSPTPYAVRAATLKRTETPLVKPYMS